MRSVATKNLGGMWPIPEGTVTVPSNVRPGSEGGLALISQRPLVTAAPVSLADYLTYPLSLDNKSWTAAIESQLRSDLRLLKVEGLADREGWHTPKPWHEVLSLGEQQSLGTFTIAFVVAFV